MVKALIFLYLASSSAFADVQYFDRSAQNGARTVVYSIATEGKCTKKESALELIFKKNSLAADAFWGGIYDFIKSFAIKEDKEKLKNIGPKSEYVATLSHSLDELPTEFCFIAPPGVRSQELRPVVLFSPGFGLPRWSNFGHVETLANSGFVVVVIDHPHTGFPNVVIYPDGNYRAEESFGLLGLINILKKEMFEVRLQDVETVIKDICADRTLNFIDCNRIGIFGQSNGGLTSAFSLSKIPSIKAAVNMDGSMFFNEVPYMKTHKPLLTLTGPLEADQVPEFGESTRKVFTSYTHRVIPFANHFEFTSLNLVRMVEPNVQYLLPGQMNPKESNSSIGAILNDFFRENL